MKVEVLEEHGYEAALRGMAYSYKDRALEPNEWWAGQKVKAERRASLLSPKDGGHNKFLESIQVWIDVEACRGWWSEMDTYRSGVTKQSESSMHTLSKREPAYHDFEEGTHPLVIEAFFAVWEDCKGDITSLKQALPEGYLQRRIISTNYKTLRNIISQRKGHRFKWWDVFIDDVLSQVKHPELLNV